MRYVPEHEIRFVAAASPLYGRDASTNIMRRIVQASGCEVTHLGPNRILSNAITLPKSFMRSLATHTIPEVWAARGASLLRVGPKPQSGPSRVTCRRPAHVEEGDRWQAAIAGRWSPYAPMG